MGQALFEKRLRRAAPGRHPFGQRFLVDTIAARIEKDLEKLGLAWCAFREGFDIGGFSGIAYRDTVNRRVQWLALAQQCRQGRRNDLADRVVIIVAREPDQPEIVLGQQRTIVESLERLADLIPGQTGLGCPPEHQADLPATAERNENPAPGNGLGLRRRGQVVELAGQRHADGDLENGQAAHRQ